MSGLEKENNEDAFEVEETLDFNKLKKENHRKYREVYAQLDNLVNGKIWPNNTINKDVLKKLQSSENYYEALKTNFFIEEFTKKIQYAGMDKETVNSIKRDIAKVCRGDKSKYEELLLWLDLYYRRTYPRPKEILKIILYAIAAALIIGIFLLIGVLTHKVVFFILCVIFLFIFVLVLLILFRRDNIEKPLK